MWNTVVFVLQIISAASAFFAAALWYCSASVFIPEIMKSNLSGPGSIDFSLKKQGKFSACAAVFAGMSALTHGTTIVIQLYTSYP